MSLFEYTLLREVSGRQIEIEINVDYNYQEHSSNSAGPDEEEGLIINSITDSEGQQLSVTDYERMDIESEILDVVRDIEENCHENLTID